MAVLWLFHDNGVDVGLEYNANTLAITGMTARTTTPRQIEAIIKDTISETRTKMTSINNQPPKHQRALGFMQKRTVRQKPGEPPDPNVGREIIVPPDGLRLGVEL